MSSIDLIRGFQTLGCKDNLKCAIASMVYLDLKEECVQTSECALRAPNKLMGQREQKLNKNINVKNSKIKNLEQCYNEELDLIYFRGERENQEPDVIVPISSCSEIDMNQVAIMQQKFNFEKKSITIAICDPNSTILYYNATNDFVDK